MNGNIKYLIAIVTFAYISQTATAAETSSKADIDMRNVFMAAQTQEFGEITRGLPREIITDVALALYALRQEISQTLPPGTLEKIATTFVTSYRAETASLSSETIVDYAQRILRMGIAVK